MQTEYEILETEIYAKWFASLKDERAKARIAKRLDRAKQGNFGEWKTEAGDVRAFIIDYGPGYRVYYVIRGKKIVILLCGGDKRNQQADINRAAKLAKEV